jgi:hypothetical protein
MNEYEIELIYEQKLDRITEHMEKLILDAMLTALQKIKKRNLLSSANAERLEDDTKLFRTLPRGRSHDRLRST